MDANADTTPQQSPEDNIQLSVSEPVNEDVDLTKIVLVILTPCYGGMCNIQFAKCLLDTSHLCRNHGIKLAFIECAGDSLVSRARNNLIAKAMSFPGTTHIMFIDSDIEWNPYDIIKLLKKDKDVIGGCYPKKAFQVSKLLDEKTNVREWVQKKNQSKIDVISKTSDEMLVHNKMLDYNLNYLSNELQITNNLIQVKHIATGFLLFKKHVIETMFEKYPETKCTDDVGFVVGDENKNLYALFDCQVRKDHYLSEDWLFCERWSDIGGTCFIDITVNLNHIGPCTYYGSLLNSLLV